MDASPVCRIHTISLPGGGTMVDFALDPRTRDLTLPPRPISGPEEVAQAIGIRLRTWLSEWFLDVQHGVPYLSGVLGKVSRPEMVEAILRAQILSVRGVTGITEIALALDPHTRTGRITFTA